MKSRIAGSLVQALRRATCVSSGGTPARKKAVMSVSATIESMGGRLVVSKGISARFGTTARSVSGNSSAPSSEDLAVCFNRAQRSNELSRSLTGISVGPIATDCALLTARPFDERTLDIMLSDEPAENLSDFQWHRNGLDQIAASIRKRLAFSRIDCSCP